MIVHVAQERLLADLAAFLEAGALEVELRPETCIDVEVPHAADRAEAEREVAIYVATWRAMNPGVRVDVTT